MLTLWHRAGVPRAEHPPKKKESEDAAPAFVLDEGKCEKVYGTIARYVEMFPQETAHVNVNDKMSLAELELALTGIQKRVGQKQELDILRSGLVSSALAVEQVSALIPGNPVKLRGLAGQVANNVEMFDTALKQIMCKYGGSFEISPETTLALALARLCAKTHMANVMEDRLRPPRVPEPPAVEEVPIEVHEEFIKEH